MNNRMLTNEELSQIPLTNETFCFTTYHDGNFKTIMASYLVPFFITKWGKARFNAEVGNHTFICRSNQPAYLIPYDDKYAVQFGLNHMTLAVEMGGVLVDINIPMEFPREVLQHMHFKVTNGKLFEPINNEWVEIKLI